MPRLLFVSVFVCAMVVPVAADEVVFTNGDRLTGKITEAAEGKLKISSTVAGDVTVDMKSVKTFSTEQPIEIHLADGSVLKQKVAAAEPGQIATAGGADVKPQTVAVASVASINPKPPEVKWTGAITANAMLTRGNTNSDTAAIRLDAVRRAIDDRITFGAGYLYGRQEDPGTGEKVTTTDSWFALGKYDYFFSKKLYAYGLARVERDRIAELDIRFAPGVGLGYQWMESPKWNFLTEAGLSWVYEKYENTDESEDHFAARFAYHYDRKLSETVLFFHNLEYLPSVEDLSDFNVNADAGIRATLVKNMFAEFKFEWKYDATPAPGAQDNDLRYLLGVGWSF